MKKSKFPMDKSLDDTYIEEYCHSVEELLKSINNKSNGKAHRESSEESRFIDDDEELLEY